MLHKLNKQGLTIIMVSHDVERCLKYCTRVVEIENGKIVKDVSAQEYEAGGTK